MTVALSDNEVVTGTYGIPLVDLPKYPGRKDVLDEKTPTEVHVGLNHKLLDDVMGYIKNHPLEWDQIAWHRIMDLNTGVIRYDSEEQIVKEVNSCGAAFCFAGHVAMAEGFPAPPKNNNATWYRNFLDVDGFREYEEVSEFAIKRLGITSWQADALFAAENDMEQLEKMVAALHINPDLNGEELEDVKYADADPEDIESWLRENEYLPVAA